MAGTIGVIAPYLAQGFLAAMMDEIHAVARRRAVQVIVFEGSPQRIGAAGLARDHVQGWILFLDVAGLQKLMRNGTPVVAVSASGCEGICPIVLPDNWGGIQAVMRHLFEHGHERIAFIGTMDNADIQQRCESYQAALIERGLPLDPQLIVDTRGYFEEHGRSAVRALLDAGRSFTAVVTAGDFNAFGAIEALRSAGLRVPEDVAVTGFDDVPGAQFADPPLTTVRQRPEAIGALAAEELLGMIGGRPGAIDKLYAPTALVQRRSCGCDTTEALQLPDPANLQRAGWRSYLATQLVILARHPLPLDPAVPVAQIWPGAALLAEGLAATLAGATAPGAAALEQAWHEAVALTDNLDTLYAMLKLIELASEQRLAHSPDNTAARARVAAFLDRARLAMMRARLDHEVVVADVFDRMARTYQEIDAALLADRGNDASGFAWLEQTLAEWACLGLWDESGEGRPPTLTIADVYQRRGPQAVAHNSLISAAVFPPRELLDVPTATEAPTNVVVLPVATATRDWGVIALRLPTARQIAHDLHGLKLLGPRLGAKLERESLLESLRAQQETLRRAYEREHALASTIREIGCPIIPLLDGMLLVPLVGVLDSTRAAQVVETVLDGVRHHRAGTILLDITGVPLMDTQVANALLQTAQAARLLGARVVMVGVRPEIAQSIVGLGLDFGHIVSYPTLAAALETLRRAERTAAGD
jgi:DNA-binding LacI/PurR family transcriptional regulator/anti-anti-sigma regulatory factor